MSKEEIEVYAEDQGECQICAANNTTVVDIGGSLHGIHKVWKCHVTLCYIPKILKLTDTFSTSDSPKTGSPSKSLFCRA